MDGNQTKAAKAGNGKRLVIWVVAQAFDATS
jgi:hypothetical protein